MADIISIANLAMGGYRNALSPQMEPTRATVIKVQEAIGYGRTMAGLIAECRAMPDKDLRDRFKRTRLPAVCLSGVIRDGYRTEADGETRTWVVDEGYRQGGYPVRHTGMYQVDGDNLTPEQVAELKAIARTMPNAALVFVSPSGTGLKLVLRGPSAKDAADHDRQWRKAQRISTLALGIVTDPAPKSPNSLCFLSSDPDLYYNPLCQPFEPATPDEDPAEQKRQAARERKAHRQGRYTTPHQSYRLHREAADWLMTALPGKGSNTYPVWLRVAKSVGGLFGHEAMHDWIEGSARPREKVNGLAALIETETEDDWAGALVAIGKEYGYRTPGERRRDARIGHQPAAQWTPPADDLPPAAARCAGCDSVMPALADELCRSCRQDISAAPEPEPAAPPPAADLPPASHDPIAAMLHRHREQTADAVPSDEAAAAVAELPAEGEAPAPEPAGPESRTADRASGAPGLICRSCGGSVSVLMYGRCGRCNWPDRIPTQPEA